MSHAIVAGIGSAVLGPLTLLLAHHTMHSSWTPGWTESAAVVALAGTSTLLASTGLWSDPAAMPLALTGPAAAVVDAREGRLPDRLTGPLCAATVVVTVTGPRATQVVVGAAIATAGAGLVAILSRSAVGWGDVKLLPTIGLVLGADGAFARGLLLILVLLVLTAALVRVVDRRGLVPYGPALVVGTLTAVLA